MQEEQESSLIYAVLTIQMSKNFIEKYLRLEVVFMNFDGHAVMPSFNKLGRKENQHDHPDMGEFHSTV